MTVECFPRIVGLMTRIFGPNGSECQAYRGDELPALLDGAIKRTGS
jgi:hypothetical protein